MHTYSTGSTRIMERILPRKKKQTNNHEEPQHHIILYLVSLYTLLRYPYTKPSSSYRSTVEEPLRNWRSHLFQYTTIQLSPAQRCCCYPTLSENILGYTSFISDNIVAKVRFIQVNKSRSNHREKARESTTWSLQKSHWHVGRIVD